MLRSPVFSIFSQYTSKANIVREIKFSILNWVFFSHGLGDILGYEVRSLICAVIASLPFALSSLHIDKSNNLM